MSYRITHWYRQQSLLLTVSQRVQSRRSKHCDLDQPVVKITLKPTQMYENKEYWFECTAEARPPITELVCVSTD